TALMNDVLILGKINASNFTQHREWIDVTTLTRDMILQFNEIDKLSAKIHLEMSGEPKKIFVDKNQFTHILLNLLGNSQKYTIDQSDIALELVFDRKQLKIKIEDHGIGMSQKDLKTVFQPFTRGRNTEGIQGTGLGMSIVQEYVSLNKGKIEIDSELNVGTTVTLTFTDPE
ncbi:MAG: signal transduction histidine kinase, partial [Cyclobacteriaceae bacterium]